MSRPVVAGSLFLRLAPSAPDPSPLLWALLPKLNLFHMKPFRQAGKSPPSRRNSDFSNSWARCALRSISWTGRFKRL